MAVKPLAWLVLLVALFCMTAVAADCEEFMAELEKIPSEPCD